MPASERPYATVAYEKADGIAHVILDRPRVFNAYSVQMRDDLWEVLSAVKGDAGIRVVIVRGNGRAFCAGADLTEFLTAPSPTAARDIRRERDIYGLLLSIPQPVIAALHGYVIGSGIEIALCCDLRIAAEGTRFSLPETGLGFIPGAGATQLLPRNTRAAPALRMVLMGRWLDAPGAMNMGLVNRLLPRDRLMPYVDSLAQRLASRPEAALRYTKRAVTEGLDMPLARGLDLEKRLAKLSH